MIVTMIIAHKFTYKTIKTMAVVSFLTIIVGLLQEDVNTKQQ